MLSQKRTYHVLLLLLSLIIGSLTYNLFLLPLNIVVGGLNGIATILLYLLGIKPSITLLITSLICTLNSYLFLGKERTIGTFCAMILYPLLVELTSNLRILISHNILFLTIISAILGGFSNGLMYKSTYSNGGLPILSQILYEKYKISIAKTSFLMNGLVIMIGYLIFGKEKTIYAILYLIINNTMIKMILKKPRKTQKNAYNNRKDM